MMNFTGQSRKRVVNLGDRRQNNLENSRNYLEKTKIQRQQREEQRLRDKSGALMKQYVIKYLALRNTADQMYESWAKRKVSNQSQFDDWVVDFYFVASWKLSFDSTENISSVINVLQDHLKRWNLVKHTNKLLMKSLIKVLGNSHVGSEPQLVHQIGLCIALVIEKSSQFNPQYPNLIDTLVPLIDTDKNLITELIFQVNVQDSYLAFLRFLSQIKDADNRYLTTVRNALAHKLCVGEIDHLSRLDKTYLLHTFLVIHGHSKFDIQDYIVIGNILSTVSFSVFPSEESHMLDNESDDDDSSLTSHKNGIRVPSTIAESIETLYSNSFIHNMMQLFTDSNDDYSRLSLNIVSTLFHLLPDFKNKLCVSITIIPGSYKWFYNQLKEDVIYKQLEGLYTSTKDYLKQDDFEILYEKLEPLHINNFWKTLYTFEELYSYWLIVSNDVESFADDKLTLEDISKFLKFSKALCLTLIFNSNYLYSNWIYEDFDKLKIVSISLLNQLYLKNLRLKFLEKDFWNIHKINLNIDSMIQIIGEEEELKSLEESDSEEKLNFRKNKVNNDTLAKLEILNKLPFFIEFNDRVQIFQSLVDLDRQRVTDDTPIFGFIQEPKIHADIRRDHLLEDAFNNFGKTGTNFKNRISVSFFNKYGEQEAGIDGGGITKEFLNSVVEDGFDPSGKFGLFKETSDNQLYPNEEIFMKYYNNVEVDQQNAYLKYLRFLGLIIGKCLYEGVLIDVSFAPFFLNKWCNSKNLMKNSLNDLNSLDLELFDNLMKLTRMTNEELEALDLNFTINQPVGSHYFKFDLIRNGDTIKVNSSNRLNYIHQIANFKLNTSLHIQSKCFLEGLFEMISSSWLKMFDFNELQMLISGSEFNINIEDWKQNVEYGGYLDNDVTIKYFWEVIEELSDKEKSKLIKFVTSVSRAPLLGFGVLKPKFGIRNSGRSNGRLPTASTCVNLLKLPDYQDKEVLRQKLLYIINTEAGFDLS